MLHVLLLAHIVQWIILLVLGFLLLGVLHNIGTLYDSIQGRADPKPVGKLTAGVTLPNIQLYTLSGSIISLRELKGAKMALNIVSTSCGPCLDLLQAVTADYLQPDPLDSSVKDRVIVSIGSSEDTSELVQRFGIAQKALVLLYPFRGLLRAAV